MRNKIVNIFVCILGISILLGGYYLKESFAIPENGKSIKIINKTEENPDIISEDDARFALIKDNKVFKLFDVGVNKGFTEINEIPAGNYIIRNYYAPKGYAFLDDQEINVDETDDSQTFELISKTDNNTKATIGMYNATTDELIPTSFNILDSSGSVVETCQTDNMTPCIIRKIAKGDYTIKEDAPPKGFISTMEQNFSVSEDGKTTVVSVKRTPTKLKICKVNSNSSAQVPGATFELYDPNNNLVDKWITTEEVHYLEGLEFGTYTLKEVKAPDGYQLKTESQTFEIKDADETVDVVFENTPTIPVENTAISKNKVYIIIGTSLLAIGVVGLLLSKKKN